MSADASLRVDLGASPVQASESTNVMVAEDSRDHVHFPVSIPHVPSPGHEPQKINPILPYWQCVKNIQIIYKCSHILTNEPQIFMPDPYAASIYHNNVRVSHQHQARNRNGLLNPSKRSGSLGPALPVLQTLMVVPFRVLLSTTGGERNPARAIPGCIQERVDVARRYWAGLARRTVGPGPWPSTMTVLPSMIIAHNIPRTIHHHGCDGPERQRYDPQAALTVSDSESRTASLAVTLASPSQERRDSAIALVGRHGPPSPPGPAGHRGAERHGIETRSHRLCQSLFLRPTLTQAESHSGRSQSNDLIRAIFKLSCDQSLASSQRRTRLRYREGPGRPRSRRTQTPPPPQPPRPIMPV
jgi:hypothetical protein